MNVIEKIKYWWCGDSPFNILLRIMCPTGICLIAGMILRNSSHIGVVNNLNRLAWIGILITCIICLVRILEMLSDITALNSSIYFKLIRLSLGVFEFFSSLITSLCCLAIFLSICNSILTSYVPVKTYYISDLCSDTLAIETGISRLYSDKIVEQLELNTALDKESIEPTKCFDTIDVRFKRKRLKLLSDFHAYMISIDEFEPEFTYHQNTEVLEGDYDCNIKVFNGITYLEVGNTKFLVKENPFNIIPTGRHHIKIYYDKSKIIDLEVYEKYKVVEIT